MQYVIGYIVIGLIVGIIFVRVEKNSFIAMCFAAIWPLAIPMIALVGFFYWVGELGR